LKHLSTGPRKINDRDGLKKTQAGKRFAKQFQSRGRTSSERGKKGLRWANGEKGGRSSKRVENALVMPLRPSKCQERTGFKKVSYCGMEKGKNCKLPKHDELQVPVPVKKSTTTEYGRVVLFGGS